MHERVDNDWPLSQIQIGRAGRFHSQYSLITFSEVTCDTLAILRIRIPISPLRLTISCLKKSLLIIDHFHNSVQHTRCLATFVNLKSNGQEKLKYESQNSKRSVNSIH